ncbi:GNAT family N-acetyltransferase [Promicromonospora iranensis]|uniref:GNAT superfamily N-acetyltransferase n=1 Tax=Promicromonospora iranensis TaxID=1105144 RepID=A0ABU2CHZ2_9MICO|nr:GNAT family N-acetyltransferase [Promicromonospora iranensis]MDR7380954.1 GNAT superfamily N-acetyltransferase [Promicromonospora iranensis]
MPDLMIAPRHAAHLDRVVEALRLVHERDGYPMVWPEDPTAWLTPPGTIDGWVALADGEIVGHVMLIDGGKVEFAAELAEAAGVPVTGLAGVSRLFVTPAARGTRVAAALLERAEDMPARRGRRLVLDVVDDGGPAIRLYERLGWVRVTAGPASWTDPAGVRPRAAAYLCPR